MKLHLTATACQLPHGITQCYLPLDISEHAPRLNPGRPTRFT